MTASSLFSSVEKVNSIDDGPRCELLDSGEIIGLPWLTIWAFVRISTNRETNRPAPTRKTHSRLWSKRPARDGCHSRRAGAAKRRRPGLHGSGLPSLPRSAVAQPPQTLMLARTPNKTPLRQEF